MKVLLLDNYDSFVYNLRQYIGELGADVSVVRNDTIDIDGITRMEPDAIVISPGPGHPANARDFGVCGSVLCQLSPVIPTLGVCLGHQGFAHHYGGKVVRANELMHGKTSVIEHDGQGIFSGQEERIIVGRYHSLVVDPDLPYDLMVTARTSEGVVMGIRHRKYPIEGVQFHPESILTPNGKGMLKNFVDSVKR